MGMDPFNFRRRVAGIPRSVWPKRLCKECRWPYQPSPGEIAALHEYAEELQHTEPGRRIRKAAMEAVKPRNGRSAMRRTVFTLTGRAVCGNSQRHRLQGRLGLHELLVAPTGEEADPGEARRRTWRSPQRRHAHAEDGRHREGVQGITDMAQVRAVCIK